MNKKDIKKLIEQEFYTPIEVRCAFQLFKQDVTEHDLDDIELEDTQRMPVQAALRDLWREFREYKSSRDKFEKKCKKRIPE